MKSKKCNWIDAHPDVIQNAAHAVRFARLCEESARERHTKGEAGIGTLQEKRLHAVIKRFLHEDTAYHEVTLEGSRFVSDLRIGKEAFEVQTGAFYPMKKKIAYYLEQTDCSVTVVHPVSVTKWTCRMDGETGGFSPRRRVGGERPETVLAELYAFLPYLGNPRLRVHLLLLETQDFRLPEGRGRRSATRRFERVPLALLGEMELYAPEDFRVFLPPELPAVFTVKELSRHTGLLGRDAYSAARTLQALGLVTTGEPNGRAMTFRRVDV